MTRCLLLPVFIGLALTLAPATRADDDEEPTFLDKKLSHWLDQLANGKETKDRLRGLVAVEQIGHEGSRKVVPALAKAMREDREEQVRARAARAVGRSVARALKQARDDKKETLPRFDDARDELIVALRTDKSDAVKEAAAVAIGDVASDFRGAVGALALALKDKNAATVTAAATALRRMGKDAREAEPELLALAGNKDADLTARVESVVALGTIRADVPADLPTLRAVLADPKNDLRLRKAAAETLGKWGKESADAAPTLAAVLLEKESKVELRLAAVNAIMHVGPDASKAVPALIAAVADEDRFVRCLALQTIVKMGEVLEDQRKPAVKAMLKATEDSIIEVAVTAVESLGALSQVGGLADLKADVLKRLSDIDKRDGRKALREASANARAKIEGKEKKDKDKEKDKDKD